jgi:branched-chain amino acid transport system substrate-binding protein
MSGTNRLGRLVVKRLVPLMLVLVVVACGGGGTTGTPANAAPYVIGAVGPLSGPIAPANAPTVDGATAFFNQLGRDNVKINGRKLEFVPVDDKADPTTALANMRDLQGRGASAVLAIFSTTFVAMTPLAKQLQMPTIGTGPTKDLVNPAQPYVYGSDIQVISEMYFEIQFLQQVIKLKDGARIAFVGAATAAGQDTLNTIKLAISDAKYQLVFSDLVPSASTDLAPTASKIRDAKPDAIALAIPDAPFTLLMNALTSLGVNVPTVDYHALGVSTLSKQNNPNIYFIRQFELTTASNPGMNKVRAAAEIEGKSDKLNTTFGYLSGWVAAAILTEALKSCSGSCSGADMEKSMEKLKVDLPGVTFQAIQYSQTRHVAVGSARVYHLDKPGGQVVQATPTIFTKFMT